MPHDEYHGVLSRLDILEHDVSDIKLEVRDPRRELGALLGALRPDKHAF